MDLSYVVFGPFGDLAKLFSSLWILALAFIGGRILHIVLATFPIITLDAIFGIFIQMAGSTPSGAFCNPQYTAIP